MASTRLPPGPRLPAVVQTVISAIRPLSFNETCQRRYGDLFTIRVFPVGDVVCVADAATIKRMMTSESDVYLAGAANSLLDFVVGTYSLLLLDGAEHIRRKQALLPPFRGENVRRHEEMIDGIVDTAVGRWPIGSTFRLLPRMQDITLEIMMRAVFGITDVERLAGLRRLIPQLLHMNPAIILFPLLRRDWGSRSPGGRFARVRQGVDDILYDEIRRRRSDPGDPNRGDVLTVLCRTTSAGGAEPSDCELRDHLVTLLAVGHETTATTMSWIFERLVRHPRVLDRLRAELDSGDTEYLNAVINETLRVRPVVSDIARTVSTSVRIGGYEIPRGTMVALSLSLLHNSPEQYPAPHEFRPERFLGRIPSQDLFLPFGGGPHRCLGASFAMTVMRSVIPAILRRVELDVATSVAESPRLRGPVLTPTKGTEVRIIRNLHHVSPTA